MKTSHKILIGVAAAAGIVYFIRRNNSLHRAAGTTPAPDTAATTGVIPKPIAENQKIIKLPDSLLVNTSGNTGIIPPVLVDSSKTAPAIKIATPRDIAIKKQTQLQGFQFS